MRKVLTLSLFVLGIVSLFVGTYAYYQTIVTGNITATASSLVFNVTGFDDEINKEITLDNGDGYILPGDSGTFNLTINATNNYDIYCSLNIERITLPDNLKFYTAADHKVEIHTQYFLFENGSTMSTSIPIYWYWNGDIDDANDSLYMNTSLEANINVEAIQISYGTMKNGNGLTSAERSAFWQDGYRENISNIEFIYNTTNVPSTCNESNLCWDVSEVGSDFPVYAYLVVSGSYVDDNEVTQNLYDLYITSGRFVMAPINCDLLFAGFNSLESIDFTTFNTSKTTSMRYMFTPIESPSGNWLGDITLLANDVENSHTTLMDSDSDVRVQLMAAGSGASYYSMLTNLDLSSFNTSNVTDMSGMFESCRNLTSLNVSSFNTSNVTDMSTMFRSCQNLTSLEISNLNTSNVTDMDYMFCDCSSLTSLDLNSFNTSKVTDMSIMFGSCQNLTSLEVSNLNTSNVTDMDYMFCDCSSLTSLDLNSFNTSKVTDMSGMFESCRNLTSLNVSSFNTSNVTDISTMFDHCYKIIAEITISNSEIASYSFNSVATEPSASLTLNYTTDTSTLVDNMISIKSANSNIVKGRLIS